MPMTMSIQPSGVAKTCRANAAIDAGATSPKTST